jgi:hypothetical protein
MDNKIKRLITKRLVQIYFQCAEIIENIRLKRRDAMLGDLQFSSVDFQGK